MSETSKVVQYNPINKPINKAVFIECVAAVGNFTKSVAADAVEAVIESLKDALIDGDTVKLTGLGSFTMKERPERQGRNPLTCETIVIPASKTVSFRASKNLTSN